MLIKIINICRCAMLKKRMRPPSNKRFALSLEKKNKTLANEKFKHVIFGSHWFNVQVRIRWKWNRINRKELIMSAKQTEVF